MILLNLRDLVYLVKLAEYGHFGRAAEASFCTQPTLSVQLKKLERQLGAPLLERSGKKVMFTPFGRQVLESARRIMSDVGDIEQAAAAGSDPAKAPLRLGAFPSLAPYLFARTLPALRRKFPGLKLKITEDKSASLLAMLAKGELDAAALALPVASPDLEMRKIYKEEFLLGVPPANPARLPSPVRHTDLKGLKFMLLDEGHCLRDQALAYCVRSGSGEDVDFRATSLETLRLLVAAGFGSTLMPETAARKGDGVKYIRFASAAPGREIALFWRRSYPFGKLAGEVAALMAECMAREKTGRP